MDIKEIIRNNFKYMYGKDIDNKIEKIRIPCMKYLEEKSIEIFKNKISEVYKINSDRLQVIDLPLLLKTVNIVEEGKWGFSINMDEDLLNYKTKSGEQIYQYSNNGLFMNTINKPVTNMKEYWHAPIGGIMEENWYISEVSKEIVDFIKKDFIKFVKNKLAEV